VKELKVQLLGDLFLDRLGVESGEGIESFVLPHSFDAIL